MKPSETADAVERTIRACRLRFENEGAQQYYHTDTDLQDFETMSTPMLAQWTREEIYDLINYCQMHLIRIDRLETAIAELDRRYQQLGAAVLDQLRTEDSEPCGATASS